MATNRRLVAPAGADFYPTPAWVTQALLDREDFVGEIWEPACGDGDMSRVLSAAGHPVFSSDLHVRNFPCDQIDFLSDHGRTTENIVTNPPFNIGEEFVLKAAACASQKSAFFLRTAFLESARRWHSIFSTIPPARVYVFSERASLYPAGQSVKGGGTTSYAWFVWDKTAPHSYPNIHWIEPGAKQ